ncbi:hypothetical protein BJ138DRAFT_1208744 [Hygrophoropsis aurantiaca]|uniref:Uncharacterized protein n=1 Tax=Hygrophoropsis aurantiaca TaxID=72124 RepID=A0ACB8A3J7_9AGAM|nr:hypothetical protein BJ138DRAFT_1208744 [Hygrophoropsis aurantiaca]
MSDNSVMGAEPVALPTFNLTDTYGAMLICVIVSAILFGLTNLQAFIYLRVQLNKSYFFSIAVCWLWFLDAFHLILITHLIYYYLVTNYFNPPVLPVIVWSFKLQAVVQVLVVYSIHCLYAQRLYLNNIGGSRFWCGDCIMLGCLSLSSLYRFDRHPDAVLASSMCYLLAASRTGFGRTDSLLRLIMIMCSLAAIITGAAMPNNFIFLGLEFFLTPQVYVNSFIALLNARHYLGPVEKTASTSGLNVRSEEHQVILIEASSQATGSTTSKEESAGENQWQGQFDTV